jgi:hypothetical protein
LTREIYDKNLKGIYYFFLNDMNVCLRRVHAASYNTNRIGGVMVRVLASSAVDRGFEVRFVLDQHAELDFYIASSLKQ